MVDKAHKIKIITDPSEIIQVVMIIPFSQEQKVFKFIEKYVVADKKFRPVNERNRSSKT